MNFIILYFTNLVLDYPLQGSFLAKEKSNSNYLLFVHSAIWGLGISIVLYYLNLFTITKMIMLVVGHYCVDYLKSRGYLKAIFKSEKCSLYIDQFIHIIQLTACLL